MKSQRYRVYNKRLGIFHAFVEIGDPCAECESPACFICDYPALEGKTCGRSLCADHASEVYCGAHYCAPHMAAYREYLAFSGILAALEHVLPFPGSATMK